MEQNKKQTAAQWVAQEMKDYASKSDIIPYHFVKMIVDIAVEKEKEQHRETFHAGFWVEQWDKTKEDKFKEYYNETYGTE